MEKPMMSDVCAREASRRCGRGFAALLPALALALALPACEPDIELEPPPEYFEFDTGADPPRLPMPNVVVLNQESGLIDYGLPNDLAVCEAPTDSTLTPAQCYFLLYLQTLDGFPTQSTVSVPASAELDLDTLTSDNFAVFALAPESGLILAWDDATRQLVFQHPDGWDVGQIYVVSIRGYDDGVTTVEGDRVVAPTAYALLKREESLINCEPDPFDPTDLIDPVVDHQCKYFELLAEGLDTESAEDATEVAAVEESLISLEALRQGFLAEGIWDAADLIAGMPKEEVAMIFAFPTHSGPVVELDTTAGKVPELVDGDTIRLAVKGDVDPATLQPGLPLTSSATIALLNVTALEQSPPDLAAGLPTYDATFIDDAIELRDATPLVPGDRYVLILRTEDPYAPAPNPSILDTDGFPLVPPPAAVALRSPYPVYDADAGTSNISSFDAADAQALEEGRLLLVDLFADPLFQQTLSREEVGYVFAFDLPSP
jgi:hypothetical protein